MIKPNIVVTCIDHTKDNTYVNMLKYWLYKFLKSETHANLFIISDTKTNLNSLNKNIERLIFDIEYDKDYQEIKKSYIKDKKKYYNHNMTISDILRFGKAPALFKNLIIIDIDAIIENKIVLPESILLEKLAGCDHSRNGEMYDYKILERLNIGFVYINEDITNKFLSKVIENKIACPWFCEDILSEIWIKEYNNIKLPNVYNWLVGYYGFNPNVYVNHYWGNVEYDSKKMLSNKINHYIASKNIEQKYYNYNQIDQERSSSI